MIGPARSTTASELEHKIRDLVAEYGALDAREIVTHFDLVVETRTFDHEGEHLRRHHWTPVGSSPHLSYGVLSAEAARVLRGLSSA